MPMLRVLLCVVALCCALLTWSQPVRILATGDMHGWLLPTAVNGQWLGGAAEMLAAWTRDEGYDPTQFLTLSCGDIATGPAISTIFQGQPVIDVMNHMGYDASALGNHEFDFNPDRIRQWSQAATFPFLAANLTDAKGKPSNLVTPYIINEEQGVKVAVIGLILNDIFTFGHADGLTTQEYAKTLRSMVPEVRKQGAQVVIVAAHVPFDELTALAKAVPELHIPLMLGAHDHEFTQRKVGATWVVNSGLWWRGYSRIDLDYQAKQDTATVLASKQVWLLQETPEADPGLQELIHGWQERIEVEYGMPLGFTATGLRRPVPAYNFITDCWLAMDAKSAMAFTNDGSLRQDIPPGQVTYATIIGMLPFDNSIVRLSLTGSDLLAYLPSTKFIGMAGVRRVGAQYLLANTSKPLVAKTRYQVLMNNYMYDASAVLRKADPTPETIFDDWRQPVRDWLLAHPTDVQHPLETLVDGKSRIEAAPPQPKPRQK